MKNILEGNDRNVIQRIVDRISSGDFEDLHVRQLLSELRDYANKNSLFYELSNFIAHPERDKGKFVEYIISYSQQIKFVWEYFVNKKQLDLFKPFPMYILDSLYEKVDQLDRNLLINNYGLTPERLKKAINKNVTKNDKHKIIFFNLSAPQQLINAVIFCLGKFGIQKEQLNQSKIIDDITFTLRKNQISFDKNTFEKESCKIMLCILLLLHLKNLETKDNGKEIPFCSILFDRLGSDRKEIYLGLYGIINSPEGDNIKIAFPIILTNLLVKDYCERVLLHEIMHSNKNNEIIRPLQFDNFKLAYSAKSKKQIMNSIIFIVRDKGAGKLRLEILSLKDASMHKDA